MEPVIELIEQMDKDLLLQLQGFSSPFMDGLMAAVTEKYHWIPLYLVMLISIFRKFGWQAIYTLVAIVLLITLSDQFTSSVLKPLVGRYRPCHDPEIGHLVRIVTKCGGYYGFVSSHAANSFAVASFFFLLFRDSPKIVIFLFIWPLLVSYSRIYLGVHYPLDVVCGGIIGAFLGILVFKGTAALSRKVPFAFTKTTKN